MNLRLTAFSPLLPQDSIYTRKNLDNVQIIIFMLNAQNNKGETTKRHIALYNMSIFSLWWSI